MERSLHTLFIDDCFHLRASPSSFSLQRTGIRLGDVVNGGDTKVDKTDPSWEESAQPNCREKAKLGTERTVENTHSESIRCHRAGP